MGTICTPREVLGSLPKAPALLGSELAFSSCLRAPQVASRSSSSSDIDGVFHGPDLDPEGWVWHQGPGGRKFWHHLALGPVPWSTAEAELESGAVDGTPPRQRKEEDYQSQGFRTHSIPPGAPLKVPRSA